MALDLLVLYNLGDASIVIHNNWYKKYIFESNISVTGLRGPGNLPWDHRKPALIIDMPLIDCLVTIHIARFKMQTYRALPG